MDSLSVTASIIAVLQLTTELVAYLNNVRHATSEQRRVRNEAASLLSLLTSLRNRVEEATSTSDEWFNQVRLLGIENGPLQQFKSAMEKMVDGTVPAETSSTKDLIKSALKWKFNKSEVEGSLQEIERLKSLIQIALSNDAFKLAQATHKDVSSLDTLTRQVQTGVQRLEIYTDDFEAILGPEE